MAYRTRINYTTEQKTEMWDRWQRGETLNAIGRAFDRGSSSILPLLAVGIPSFRIIEVGCPEKSFYESYKFVEYKP